MNGKQLKNSILQWAIQGKLVPQDPNDEPASVLLERIREEKARLVKEKKIKKDKNESIIFRGDDNSHYEKFLATGEVKCIDDEIPFEIPQSWCWVRLKSIVNVARGGSPRPIKDYITEAEDGINWIKIGDTEKDGKYINYTREKIMPAGLKKSRLIHKGDFLLTNSMSFGRPYISNIEGCIHDGWLVISPIGESFIQDYLYYLLSSRFSYDQFCGVVSGAVVQNLNSDKVAGALFPLPPIEEQKRIVEFLESIMPHIKTYELAQSQLDRLNMLLMPKFKKAVLQEAIQGRLVPQDPNDEPASVLLERIREEKQRLLKEGKLKKKDITDSIIFKGEDNKYYEKVGSEINCIDDEIPFEIPLNWQWSRFGCIMINRDSERVPLSVSEREHLSKIYDYYGASGVIDKVDKYLFDKDLLLIGEDGANLINRSTPIAFIASGRYWVNNHAHVLDVCGGLLLQYIALYINAISLVDYVTGTAQPKMNQEKMNSILVAVPPVKEQVRIVNHLEFVIASIMRR